MQSFDLRHAIARAVLRVATVALLAVGLHAQAGAQLFDGVDWFEREVGEGVVWRHYWFDDLMGSPQSISYLDADLNDPNVHVEFPFLPGSRALTSKLVPEQFPHAVAAVNGTFFDTSTGGGGATTFLRVQGVQINPPGYTPNGNWNNSSAVAIDADGGVSIMRRPSPSNNWAEDTEHPDILANGPMLVEDGATTHFGGAGAHCSNRHPRTFIGTTADNHLILATADGRTSAAAGLTCDEMALVMHGLHCVDAFSVDGGGSTTMWVKGEPFNGVVSYPSDNSVYDHLGERACSNAVAIVARPAAPHDFDARLTATTYVPNMLEKTTQTVSFKYRNIGAQTWTVEGTSLRLSRPDTRTSPFQDASWPSAKQPAKMSPSSVAPGEEATFSFAVAAPAVEVPTSYLETFALQQEGYGRFGPANNEARLNIFVELPVGSNIVVESRRPDGSLTPAKPHTSSTYEEIGTLADTSSKSVIEGGPRLVGSGARFTSNTPGNHGKKARFRPMLPSSGTYNVYVTVGNGTNNDAMSDWRLVSGEATMASGTVHLGFDDPSVANAWKLLASEVPLSAGTASFVEFNNNPGGKNRFVMDAVRFELTGAIGVDVTKWVEYD